MCSTMRRCGARSNSPSALAKLSPEDPELMPELGPQTYASVNGFVERTADLDARGARRRGQARDRGRSGGRQAAGNMFVAGFLEANAGASAVATSHGLFAYHRTTDADFSTTVRTPDGTGSGWAGARRARLGQVDPAALGAHRRAEGGRQPQPAGDRARALHRGPRAGGRRRSRAPALGALNARSADEGRSASRSRAAARASARRCGRARDALLGSGRSGSARRSRSTAKGCR